MATHWWKNLPNGQSDSMMKDADRIEHLDWEIGLHEKAIQRLRNEQVSLERKHDEFVRNNWTQEQRDEAYGMRQ